MTGQGFGFRILSGSHFQLKGALGSLRASHQGKVPSCRIYPNGDFGLGYKVPREESDPFSPSMVGGVSIECQRRVCGELALGAPWLVKSEESSQEDSKSREPKVYGKKGITNYGKKMVRNGAFLLQRKAGKARLSFLTLTVPDLKPESLVLVGQAWGEMVRQTMQYLSRRLERAGLPREVVLVSETQTQRLRDGSLGCLHLHGLFVGRHPSSGWVIHYSEIRTFWNNLLSRVTGERVDSEAVERLERVKKSAENYLSKYMSKGIESVDLLIEIAGEKAIPRQWWNMTKGLRNSIRSGTLCGETISIILELLINNHYRKGESEPFKFVRTVTVPLTENQDYVVGYFGRVTHDTLRDLTEMRDGLKSA